MSREDRYRTGLVHLYYGDGKGKTTAAMGLALRAVSAGMSVFIVQFLKSRASGEIKMLENLPGVTVLRGKSGKNFVSSMSEDEKRETKAISDRNFMSAMSAASCGVCELLILDEICAAWNENLLEHSLVERFLANRPANTEIVLTGRNPPDIFIESADYCTEFKKIKHPFDNGLGAREGIEY